jgi:citrate synthase
MSNGLEGIVATETVLSDVDGEAGELILRGHFLEELAGRRSFEDVTALLWQDLVEAPSGATGIAAAMGEGRAQAFPLFAGRLAELDGLSPIEGTRLLVSAIGDASPLAEPGRLVGAVGLAAAMAVARSEGHPLLEPDASAPHAADILRIMRARAADRSEAEAIDAYLVTIIDHGLNASTFAARIVASTAAGRVSSVLAGISALKGPLHGGAPGPVLDMLDAIGAPGNAEAWLERAIDTGERLMGFGHRVYRVRDPRADVLKRFIGRFAGGANRVAFAEAVEKAALAVLRRRKSGRRLDVNVEFYTALLLEALGVPRSAFTPLFAAGRVAGWVGHVAEQEKFGRLFRPASAYTGPQPLKRAG